MAMLIHSKPGLTILKVGLLSENPVIHSNPGLIAFQADSLAGIRLIYSKLEVIKKWTHCLKIRAHLLESRARRLKSGNEP